MQNGQKPFGKCGGLRYIKMLLTAMARRVFFVLETPFGFPVFVLIKE
jgi:hypothetical protein